MDTVGIIGAGQMGAGIAQTVAQKGITVVLADRELAIAEKARDKIAKRLARLVEKGQLEAGAADAALARIRPSADYAPMAEAGLIIEAATEREEIKRAIFEAAGEGARPKAILASNTSSIPITGWPRGTADPARFIGLHFFNPVPVMALVEVIPGPRHLGGRRSRARGPSPRALGKQVVLSRDEPGFIVNRVLLPMINEAVFVLGRRHRERRRHRQGLPARAQPPDGAARAGRLHRARHLPRDHPRAHRRHRRSEVPARAAAGEVRRGRLARAQERPRVLRLLAAEEPVPTR